MSWLSPIENPTTWLAEKMRSFDLSDRRAEKAKRIERALELRSRGKTNEEIAEIMGAHRSSVYKWIGGT